MSECVSVRKVEVQGEHDWWGHQAYLLRLAHYDLSGVSKDLKIVMLAIV